MASPTQILLHPPSRQAQAQAQAQAHPSPASPGPLPQFLQTPTGLAILELQGTINLPEDPVGETPKDVHIGRIEFPDYSPDAIGSAWMKRVYMYVGQHQRLIGEVKKLPRALAVVRRREASTSEGSRSVEQELGDGLEIVEIVTHKIMFSGRPEPVGMAHSLA